MISSLTGVGQNVFGMNILPFLAALLAGTLAATAGPLLRIQDLGTFGGSQMSGTAINRNGEIAGHGVDGMGGVHAFTAINGFTDITPVGSGGAAAYGVSGSGEVVGQAMVNGNSQATLWSNGTAQNLGGLGGPDSYANAINDNSEAAGMATTVQGQGRAVIYASGAVRDVSLPGSLWSSAYALDNSGRMAGYAMTASGVFQGYTWSALSGFSSLGTLGGANSYAFGINDHGQVVGHSTLSSGYSHAFLTDDHGMHDLGTLGGNASYAYGINNAGSVVGYSWLAGSDQTHAFLYVGGVMLDLNSLVTNLTGWTLTEAYSINDAGQIAGAGLLDGITHAFRLDPLEEPGLRVAAQAVPEPGTTATLAIGFAMLVGKLVVKRRSVHK